MGSINQKIFTEKIFVILFFFVATSELVAELFSYKPLIFAFKPLIPIILMVLYWKTSQKREPIFFLLIIASLITGIFFINNSEISIFLGLLFYFVYRIVLIFYILKIIKMKDYIPLFIAMLPFLFFFFYLLSLPDAVPSRIYYVVILQNILISVLAGIILSHFMMFYQKKSTWFFIFGLLSVSHYFIVFIERYYLSGTSAALVFRVLAMILSSGVYFSLYNFVKSSEKLNNN